MIEVFFSKTAKYSMESTQNRMNIGTDKEILFIGSHLDIGPISPSTNEIERYQSLNKIMNNDELFLIELEQLKDTQSFEVEKLIQAAKSGEVIRIWKSKAAFSACAFAYICYRLKDIQCEINIMHLESPQINQEGNLVSYAHWGEVCFRDYTSFLKNEKRLLTIEKKKQSKLWEKLRIENSPLRALVSGQLLSVPENFYDHLLINTFTENESVVGEIIADVLGKYPLAVSDRWYLYRINQWIKENKLIITSKKDIVNPFQKTIKVNF